MLSIICGEKGKRKTLHLLEKANTVVAEASGNVIYLDKSYKNMYELSNKIRLINVCDYPFISADGFIGFIMGLISSDHDLEYVFLDSFLKLANLEACDITATIDILEKLGEKYNINFVVSISAPEADLPQSVKKNILLSL